MSFPCQQNNHGHQKELEWTDSSTSQPRWLDLLVLQWRVVALSAFEFISRLLPTQGLLVNKMGTDISKDTWKPTAVISWRQNILSRYPNWADCNDETTLFRTILPLRVCFQELVGPTMGKSEAPNTHRHSLQVTIGRPKRQSPSHSHTINRPRPKSRQPHSQYALLLIKPNADRGRNGLWVGSLRRGVTEGGEGRGIG